MGHPVECALAIARLEREGALVLVVASDIRSGTIADASQNFIAQRPTGRPSSSEARARI
jgi:hypothetical protein